MLQCGCNEKEIYESDISTLVEGQHLQAAIASLRSEKKEKLTRIFKQSSFSQRQERHQSLNKDIQELEAELVFVKVIASMNDRLGADAISTLKSMAQNLRKMNSGLLASGKTTSERSNRYLKEFISLFKEAVEFMPFLVMTMEQVSIFLPPLHSVGLGITDESSQSSCAAITLVTRCEKMLVVGDDKQVSPSLVGVGEDLIKGLEQSLPGIPKKSQLLPGSSFLDLFDAIYPLSGVSLREHFRCHPDIIAISNKEYYLGELIPLRMGNKESNALVHELVDGTRDEKIGRAHV